jgi:hypothetical protein
MNVTIFWDIAPCSSTNISEEYITSIFRVEYLPCKKAGCRRWLNFQNHVMSNEDDNKIILITKIKFLI